MFLKGQQSEVVTQFYLYSALTMHIVKSFFVTSNALGVNIPFLSPVGIVRKKKEKKGKKRDKN